MTRFHAVLADVGIERLAVLLVPLLAPASMAAVTISLQNGLNGYAGAIDTTLSGGAPNSFRGGMGSDFMWVDYPLSGTSDTKQMGLETLMRFDGIFGDGPGQIPLGSSIYLATLTVVTGDSSVGGPGHGGTLHRMLKPWAETDTWNSWGNGIQANNLECNSTYYAQAGNSSLSPMVGAGLTAFNVTTDIQAWSSGASNYGWAILPWTNGTDGWGMKTSEWPYVVSERPMLYVTFTAVPEPGSALLVLAGIGWAVLHTSRRRRAPLSGR